MSASEDETREEMRGRLADMLRMAGHIAGGKAGRGVDILSGGTIAEIVEVSLRLVVACERACGIGGDA